MAEACEAGGFFHQPDGVGRIAAKRKPLGDCFQHFGSALEPRSVHQRDWLSFTGKSGKGLDDCVRIDPGLNATVKLDGSFSKPERIGIVEKIGNQWPQTGAPGGGRQRAPGNRGDQDRGIIWQVREQV
ncbi:hypothetical protein [Phyllobacterium sp. YR620]|uniref:hypothetical protein n=1 Tax=Phyllobacterium sp. YR620 TaxID=1881066 RepID=UPI001FCDB450|nr:hypothetical protein [Phyllobacterium sp. YR620]